MRAIYFIFTALSLAFLSCKKEKAEKPAAIPETPCVCQKENMGTGPINQIACYGFLTMTAYTDLTKDTPLSYVTTKAFFTAVPNVQEDGAAIVGVDSVFLNQQHLKSIKDANGAHIYYQNDYNAFPSQQSWSIYGANGIPTFTYSADVKSPTADLSQLPASLNKSLLRSFKINGVANITGGFATLMSAGQSGTNVTVRLKEGSNDVCFPEDQVKLVATGKATLLIVLDNTLTKTFNNKNIAFSKKIQFTKSLTLNP